MNGRNLTYFWIPVVCSVVQVETLFQLYCTFRVFSSAPVLLVLNVGVEYTKNMYVVMVVFDMNSDITEIVKWFARNWSDIVLANLINSTSICCLLHRH
jgi:hypothetical protein